MAAAGCGICQGRGRTGGRESKAELSGPSRSELHGEKKTKEKHQLSFHVQRVLHNCIIEPSILASYDRLHKQHFLFCFYLSHMLCVQTRWHMSESARFQIFSQALSNFPRFLHRQIVWRKFSLSLNTCLRRTDLFSEAFQPSSVD